MNSFKLTDEELSEIFSPNWMRLSIKKRNVRIKDPKKASTMDFMLFHLLKGHDVFVHFSPKQENDFLISALRGDYSHVIPYESLYVTAVDFASNVPHNEKIKEMSWSTASYKIRDMDKILDNLLGVSYTVLVKLRPYIVTLRNKLASAYGITYWAER